MVTMRKIWRYAAVVFTLGYLLIGAKSLSAQGACKLVIEAMNRVASTPTHVYSTMNLGGKNQAVETILCRRRYLYTVGRQMEPQSNDTAGDGGDAETKRAK